MSAPPSPVSSVLVIAPQQLGDALICTPLIHAARVRWPDARIDVLGQAGALELLKGNPDIAALIEMTRDKSLAGRWRELRGLWKRYDVALVTRGSDRAHVYGLVAARQRSALLPSDGPGSRWKRWMSQHRFVIDLQRHQVLEKLQLMEPWQPASGDTALSMTPPQAAPLPEALAEQLRAGMVVVHVPSMWRYKQWPLAHYRRVVERLLESRLQVVLTGAPNDHDRAMVAEVRTAGHAPDLIDACGGLSFAQLVTLLSRADAYLGPDTSVTHLAAAVGLPIVTMFGPTAPTSFGPWPRGHAATQPWQARAQRQRVASIVIFQGPDLPGRGKCVPCGRSGCDDHRDSASHCLDQLEPERVAAQLLSMIKLPAKPGPWDPAKPWKPPGVARPA